MHFCSKEDLIHWILSTISFKNGNCKPSLLFAFAYRHPLKINSLHPFKLFPKEALYSISHSKSLKLTKNTLLSEDKTQTHFIAKTCSQIFLFYFSSTFLKSHVLTPLSPPSLIWTRVQDTRYNQPLLFILPATLLFNPTCLRSYISHALHPC